MENLLLYLNELKNTMVKIPRGKIIKVKKIKKMNPKEGDFLKSKKNIKIPKYSLETKQEIGVFELDENELCKIKIVHLYPKFLLEVECRENIIGFSLVDLDKQEYEFYQHIFCDYTLNKNDIRKEKLIKINKLE